MGEPLVAERVPQPLPAQFDPVRVQVTPRLFGSGATKAVKTCFPPSSIIWAMFGCTSRMMVEPPPPPQPAIRKTQQRARRIGRGKRQPFTRQRRREERPAVQITGIFPKRA